MDPRERELLTGMGNCYAACGEEFEATVEMVAGARNLEPQEVRSLLVQMRVRYAHDTEYQSLRARLPPEFPL
ncbi:MAG TPA: hypothetical protein VGV89_05595 [Thermoplasmata archaeon]|nr:hypothetical protein [Thermoplasmata archaeon]